jgi:hypothetical protein
MESWCLKHTGKRASSAHQAPNFSVVGDTILKIIFGIWTAGVISEGNFLNKEVFVIIISVIKSENI